MYVSIYKVVACGGSVEVAKLQLNSALLLCSVCLYLSFSFTNK